MSMAVWHFWAATLHFLTRFFACNLLILMSMAVWQRFSGFLEEKSGCHTEIFD
jgi:hypothetical protein